MKQTLYIIRGLPGSGKTTLAKMMSENLNILYFEADMFFYDAWGKYHFESKKLGKAHEWCQQQVAQALQNRRGAIVSNTFVKIWEIMPYEAMTRQMPAQLHVMECVGSYKNVHSVPEDKIMEMFKNWEEWEP